MSQNEVDRHVLFGYSFQVLKVHDVSSYICDIEETSSTLFYEN